MNLPPEEAVALAEAARKERIARLQKRIDAAVKTLVADNNRLHPHQEPLTLARKPLVVRKAPKGKFTLVVSMIHALQSLDGQTLTKLATAGSRSKQIAVVGPLAIRHANQAKDVRLTSKEVTVHWLNKELTKSQREKARAALNESWRATAKVTGRRLGRLDTPAKFLDFVVEMRQSATQKAAVQSPAPDQAATQRRELIWFSDKRTMWFREDDGKAVSTVVSWHPKRPGSTQFRLPGVPNKRTLSTFAREKGYSLDDIVRLSDDAQLQVDADVAKEREDAETQAALDVTGLFDVDSLPTVEEADHAS